MEANWMIPLEEPWCSLWKWLRSKEEDDQGFGVGGSDEMSDSEDACKGGFFAAGSCGMTDVF